MPPRPRITPAVIGGKFGGCGDERGPLHASVPRCREHSSFPLISTSAGFAWHIWGGLFPWNDLIDMLAFDVRCLSGFYEPSLLSPACLQKRLSVSQLFSALAGATFPSRWTKPSFICSSMTFLKSTDSYPGCDVAWSVLLLAKRRKTRIRGCSRCSVSAPHEWTMRGFHTQSIQLLLDVAITGLCCNFIFIYFWLAAHGDGFRARCHFWTLSPHHICGIFC